MTFGSSKFQSMSVNTEPFLTFIVYSANFSVFQARSNMTSFLEFRTKRKGYEVGLPTSFFALFTLSMFDTTSAPSGKSTSVNVALTSHSP